MTQYLKAEEFKVLGIFHDLRVKWSKVLSDPGRYKNEILKLAMQVAAVTVVVKLYLNNSRGLNANYTGVSTCRACGT